MRITELLRLVWLNINQNKFKSIMTSIGIVVGAATIMLVIGIGRGGQLDIAEQFAELNAGEINISYEYEEEETSTGGGGGGMFGAIGDFFGGTMGSFSGGGGMPFGGGNSGGGMSFGGGNSSGGNPFGGGGMSFGGGDTAGGGNPFGGGRMSFGGGDAAGGDNLFSGGATPFSGGGSSDDSGPSSGFSMGDFEGFDGDNPFESPDGENGEETTEEEETEVGEEVLEERLNQHAVTLSVEDVEDIEKMIPGISGATISYTIQNSVEGGNLRNARTYTIAGVKESFENVSKLQIAEGNFLTDAQDSKRSRECVLGSDVAKEVFGSAEAAIGQTLYIDGKSYSVYGVMKTSGYVTCGITLDTAVFVPYETGIKYLTGNDMNPKLTVIAENVDTLQEVIRGVRSVLETKYSDISFTFADAGSKMKAAESSNRILTMLLSAMAAIVFLVGGIGIMNVLFVSVKERTNEIGILKALGTAQGTILMEFLLESAAISFMGGILGIGAGFLVSPIVRRFDVRIEVTLMACLIALGFAVLTGTIFGFYPAWKASRLEPVEALNAE